MLRINELYSNLKVFNRHQCLFLFFTAKLRIPFHITSDDCIKFYERRVKKSETLQKCEGEQTEKLVPFRLFLPL